MGVRIDHTLHLPSIKQCHISLNDKNLHFIVLVSKKKKVVSPTLVRMAKHTPNLLVVSPHDP